MDGVYDFRKGGKLVLAVDTAGKVEFSFGPMSVKNHEVTIDSGELPSTEIELEGEMTGACGVTSTQQPQDIIVLYKYLGEDILIKPSYISGFNLSIGTRDRYSESLVCTLKLGLRKFPKTKAMLIKEMMEVE